MRHESPGPSGAFGLGYSLVSRAEYLALLGCSRYGFPGKDQVRMKPAQSGGVKPGNGRPNDIEIYTKIINKR
jgi:hypothetical protein